MVQHAREEKRRSVLQNRADLEVKLEAVRRRERKVRERQESGQPTAKKRKLNEPATEEDEEDQFILEDYQSDDENSSNTRKGGAAGDLGLSKETEALMQKLGFTLQAMPQTDDTDPVDELKIFFCSRTHSQLTQFVGELRRLKIPPAIPPENDEKGLVAKDTLSEELKHLTLGSRKNLCINSKVTALKHPTAMNERCLELQDSKTPQDRKCQFVPNKDNEAAVLDFQHYALSKIRDIEDLGTIGKKLGVCPYYSTRPTVKPSEV